jgi:hypothetical protein
MEDAEAAENGQHVPFVDGLRVGWRPCQERDDRAGREVRDHFAESDAKALGVRGMEQDLGAGEGPDLVDAADVIGVAVGADDAGDVLHRTPDARQVRPQEARGSGVPRVDERDLVPVDEQVGLSTDESHDMNVW